jgi:hypothetical protein
MPFPTATDLAFYQARHQPKWADRIGKNYTRPSLTAPNIDHVINAHAGVRLGDTNAHNLMVFVQGWRKRGEDTLVRLLEMAETDHTCATPNRKRAALAKKWATRLQANP